MGLSSYSPAALAEMIVGDNFENLFDITSSGLEPVKHRRLIPEVGAAYRHGANRP